MLFLKFKVQNRNIFWGLLNPKCMYHNPDILGKTVDVGPSLATHQEKGLLGL